MTQSELRELKAIGAELGAAKAENDRLRGLLRELREITIEYAWDADLEARVDAALSQQDESECRCTMRERTVGDGCSVCNPELAAELEGDEPAPAQDETEPVYQFQWREIGEGDWMACSHSWFRFCEASPEHDTRVVEVARPAQTAPQGKFRMGDLVKKSTGSEWVGHICGTYSTALNPEGYAVESEAHKGSVQIYPAKALEAVE